jgi:aminomethyltransferase
MGLRTPLYEKHLALGGRMVDFAGWIMPVQYTTIVEEHVAVRTAAGVFDVSHMGRLSVTGPDALALVQQVYSNNAATLAEGQARYGLVCNERGGIRDDVLVYRWPTGYAFVVNASNREKVIAWLAEHRGSRDVQVEDQTQATAMVAVQGPAAVGLCRDLTGADPAPLKYYHATQTTYRGAPAVLSRTGYTGEDGVEVTVPADLAGALWDELVQRGARPCGLGARDTLRLEAAMPLYGHELDEQTDPLQAGLGWAVKLDKGDFVGREALLRLQADKARLVRVGIELAGKRIAREGAKVSLEGYEVGRVTSGTFAPTLEKAVAMAYVEPRHAGLDTQLTLGVRGKAEPGWVVPLPFYKRPRK